MCIFAHTKIKLFQHIMRRLLAVAMGALVPLVMNAQISVTVNGVSTEYRTFTQAVNAVNRTAAGVKPLMKMTRSVKVDWDEEAPAIAHSVDIDLNGMTLSSPMSGFFAVDGEGIVVNVMDKSADEMGTILFNSESSDFVDYAVMVRNGQLTLQSGCIESEHRRETCGSVWVVDGGKFTVNGGYVINTSFLNARAILNEGGTVEINGGRVYAGTGTEDFVNYCYAIVNTGNGVLTVNKGSIESSSSSYNAYAVHAANGTVTLKDGDFTANDLTQGACLYLGSATATIEGGKYITNHTDGNYFDIQGGSADKVKISGGYFSKEGNLKKFIGNKHLAILPKESQEWAEGLRFRLSDVETITDVAKNLTSGKGYQKLETALAEAQAGDTVSLLKDYKLTTSVNVKKGVVMLIPFDMLNTCYTDRPMCAYTHVEEQVYRTLTVADGVRITVDGELSVCATVNSQRGAGYYGCGSVFGNYGFISLGKDAEVSVKGTLYCYGYIAGEGRVVMEDNSTLYENFHFTDWRGGNRSSKVMDYMYVLNQYYVQNVECPLTMKRGVKNIGCSAINVMNDNMVLYDVNFVGEGGLFLPGAQTTITRTYDGKTDRIHYLVDGNMKLGGLTLGLASIKYTCNGVPCPLTSNMTIEMKNGTLAMDSDYVMLPGAEIVIGEKAELHQSDDAHLYMLDRDDWGHFAVLGYSMPLEYTIANGHKNRLVRWGTDRGGFSTYAWNALDDAKLDVKGSAYMAGKVMCSDHGAKIVSSNGAGVISFTSGIADTDTWVYTNIDNTFDLDSISVSVPQLTAADGTLVKVQPGKAVRYSSQGAEWKASPIIKIDDITALIADYLKVGTTVVIDDITDLIRRYLEQ